MLASARQVNRQFSCKKSFRLFTHNIFCHVKQSLQRGDKSRINPVPEFYLLLLYGKQNMYTVQPSANCTRWASSSQIFWTLCVGVFVLCNNFCSSVTWSDDLLKVHRNYAIRFWDDQRGGTFSSIRFGLFVLCNYPFLETWYAGLHKLHCNNDTSRDW